MSNRNSKGQFVKGHSIVGNRAGSVGPWRGKKRPDMSARHKGSSNPAWKEDIGLGGLHGWLRSTFPDAGPCEQCGSSSHVDWALKTGCQYERKRENFARLCRSCHMKYDYANGSRKRYIPTPEVRERIRQTLKARNETKSNNPQNTVDV